jgi:isoleucyl-tRNA synthetase
MAPFTPFITERVWQDLFRAQDVESVHLSAWPDWIEADIDDTLAQQVELTRRIVELGRAARANSGVKTRQPLGRALVAAAGWSNLPESLAAQIREEVNVLALDSLAGTDELVDVSVKANFKSLGARYGKQTPLVAQAIANEDANSIVAAVRAGETTIEADGQPYVITIDDVVITEVPREGWTVASADGESLALDLELTPALIAQGIARDVTRLIQDARKSSGFDISDRIEVVWHSGSDQTIAAISAHAEDISQEVLATSWTNALITNETVRDEELDLMISISKV